MPRFADLLNSEQLDSIQEVVNEVEKKQAKLEKRRHQSLPKVTRRFLPSEDNQNPM